MIDLNCDTCTAGKNRQHFVEKCVHRFGAEHRAPHIAKVVLDFYEAALKASSQRTYRTGQRAYHRFVESLYDPSELPFVGQQLNETELTLAFFMAHLLLKPTMSVGTTILNYESHVKY